MAEDRRRALRAIPAVHRLLEEGDLPSLRVRYGQAPVRQAADQFLEGLRQRMQGASAGELAGMDLSVAALASLLAEEVGRLLAPRLRPVINATGVVLHTNLGRSVLSAEACAAMIRAAASYSNLELDLATGRRGSRQAPVEGLLPQLTGAEAAYVVNNNAAAVLLALTALARGRDVILSRGELVEIGGSFRIPDVLAQSGARLVEVGTTNKTRLEDYRRALGPETAVLLKVHTSNYRIVGFTEEVPLAELAALAREAGLPCLYDLGSGSLQNLARLDITGEPSVGEALAAGADLVAFSGDKLLGGPQAGCLVGRRDLVDACRRHPLARALRIDKLCLAALEATLAHYLDDAVARDRVPTLAMLAATPQELEARARALWQGLAARLGEGARVALAPGTSRAGGGSLPEADLPTTLVAVSPARLGVAALEARLRAGEPPVMARVAGDCLLLDVRTLLPGQEEPLAAALETALLV